MYLNNFQTKQKKDSLIHWDSLSKESYWIHFNKRNLNTEQEWDRFESTLKHPDYEKAKKGIDEYNFKPF